MRSQNDSKAYGPDSGIVDTLVGFFDRRQCCSLGQRRFRRRSSRFRVRIHCCGETSWRDKAGSFPRSRLADSQNLPPIVVVYSAVRVVTKQNYFSAMQ